MLSCTEGSPPHYNRGRSSRSLQSASSGGEVSLEASSPPAEAGGDCRRSLNSLKAQEKSPADLNCIMFISCRWSNGSIYVRCCAACHVWPRPGHSRQSWGGDGGDTSYREQHPGRGPHCPPRTCPAQPWPGTSGQRRWNTAALGPIGFRFMQMPRSMMC